MILPTPFTLTLRRIAFAVGAACALGAAGNAAAVTLQQAYDAALKNDPAFRMNFYENEMGKENRILGRAGLLPNISASYSASQNHADIESEGQFGIRQLTHPRFISRSSAVQLRQPIINLDAIARYKQGVAQANQSEAQFEANTGEVALRAVGAYFDALFAEDQLSLALVQRDMYNEQQKVNAHLFEKGEGTKTDKLETQARLDLAEAQVIEAQDNLTATRHALEAVIGMDPGTLDKLGTDFRFEPLSPAKYEDWSALALANNHDLQAARFAVENARQEINKARAGHAPRLDFVASYSKDDAVSVNSYNQNSVNRTIGIQLNVPIYAGGAVNASTRQAAAGYERAKADLDGKTNKVMIEVRKAHDLVVSSATRVAALVKAVESSKELMKATEQSIKGGVRINLDLLNAQQQLYTSQRDLAQARYSYLLGVLRLHAATGSVDRQDVQRIAAYLR
jgi:protease secretion system outer membrane protein